MGDSNETATPVVLAAPPPALTATAIDMDLLYPDSFWSAGQFTYSIPTTLSTWPSYTGDSEASGAHHFTALNATQAARFAFALGVWDSLITPNFVQTDDATSPGNIRVGFSDDLDTTEWGHTYLPAAGGGPATPHNGDIWIADRNDATTFEAGSYDYTALLHELGHAMGLKHPFEDGPTLPTEYDNRRYTVMSYTAQTGEYAVTFTQTGNTLQGHFVAVEPTTPMVLDIAAVQARYGADPTTAPGDTPTISTASRCCGPSMTLPGPIPWTLRSTPTRRTSI